MIKTMEQATASLIEARGKLELVSIEHLVLSAVYAKKRDDLMIKDSEYAGLKNAESRQAWLKDKLQEDLEKLQLLEISKLKAATALATADDEVRLAKYLIIRDIRNIVP